MTGQERSEAEADSRLMGMIWPGAFAAQAIYVAAKLNFADILADDPRSADDVANAAGTNPAATERLLRALTSLDLFKEVAPGEFANTPLSESLRIGRYARAWAVMLGSPFVWQPWGNLLQTVTTGAADFEAVFNTTFYRYLAEHPDQQDAFDAAMNAGSEMQVSAVTAVYDFTPFEIIADIGGGRGALLEGILDSAPHTRGVLFDFPSVVAKADSLRSGPFAKRCDIVGGDMFNDVPPADAYVLKNIIHGFADTDAVRVLKNCRQSIRSDGRLLLIELVLDPEASPDPGKALMDMMMLALVPGRERSEPEFGDILSDAGFELLRVIPTERGNSVIEAKPV